MVALPPGAGANVIATSSDFVGYAMVAMGLVLAVFAILGMRHAKRAQAARIADAPVLADRKQPITASV